MKISVLALMFSVFMGTAQAESSTIDQQTFSQQKQVLRLDNSMDIAYVEMGNPQGKPILLIHGFTDNARSWSLMLPYLDKNYRIIAMDLRGHGKSSAPECCYSIKDLSYDAKLLLDKLKIDKAVVVGHSLGSIVTQNLAELWPEKVERAVLIASTTTLAEVMDKNGWLSTEVAKLKSPIDPNSQFMLDWYANPTKIDDTFILKERQESAAVPLHVWKAIIDEGQVTEFGRRLDKLSAPVLVLAGGKDQIFGPDIQAKLKAELPNAEFITFPEAGHNIMWEKPEEVAQHISAFISK